MIYLIEFFPKFQGPKTQDSRRSRRDSRRTDIGLFAKSLIEFYEKQELLLSKTNK
jgi:hypothetical protein